MVYLRAPRRGQDDGDDIESAGAVFDVVGGEEVAGGAAQSGFFGGGDGFLWRSEAFIGSGSNLGEDDGVVGINHNEVDFTGLAGEVASEGSQTPAFQESLAAFFAPPAEEFWVGQQLGSF